MIDRLTDTRTQPFIVRITSAPGILGLLCAPLLRGDGRGLLFNWNLENLELFGWNVVICCTHVHMQHYLYQHLNILSIVKLGFNGDFIDVFKSSIIQTAATLLLSR